MDINPSHYIQFPRFISRLVCPTHSPVPFQVGMFKIHPEIPEALSAEAKSFILRCFEPDPNKRATAGDLLKDVFVRQNVKGKKSKIAFKPSGSCNTPLLEGTITTISGTAACYS